MYWFPSYKTLEKKLRKLSDVSFTEEKKQKMKTKLMLGCKRQLHFEAYEENQESLVERIRELALQIFPSAYFRTLLREKLLAIAEFPAPSWSSFLHGKFSRRVFAAVVAAVFVFTVMFNFTFRIPRAEASMVTVLKSVEGEVFIVREGKESRGEAGFLLKADDVVKTGPGAAAGIEFLDQSVSRLDENTEVKISKLFVNPQNKTQTIVELVLHEGRLWARVINLIDNVSRFQVKAENTVAVTNKKAAFDVSVTPQGKAKVQAVQYRVDLVVATEKKVVETTLMKGFSAEVKNTAPQSVPSIVSEKTPDVSDTWVADNLAKDEEYIATVKQEVQQELTDQVKSMSGNPFYAVNIALTLDDFDRQKKVIVAAQERLAEAQLFFDRGQAEKALEIISLFQSQLIDMVKWIRKVEPANPAEALELENVIAEMLGTYEKKLSMYLPNDSLYALKSAVLESKVLVADDPVKKTEEKLAQASEKLAEAHDLASQGDSVGAGVQVDAYTGAISQVVSDVKELTEDEQDKTVSAILDNKVEDLKALQSISETPSFPAGTTTEIIALVKELGTSSAPVAEETGTSTTPPLGEAVAALPAGSSTLLVPATPQENADFKKKVEEAKTETLVKLGEAVQAARQTPKNVEVFQRLQDLKQADVNGKPLIKVTLGLDSVTLKSDGTTVTVGTSTPLPQPIKPLPLPLTDSKIPELPQALP